MELCVMIEGQEGVSWQQWRAIAAACEEHGIGALFRSDHYLPLGGFHEREVLDAWATTCALAAVTTTLELGTLVSPATFRHPSELAKLAATADAISGGRVTLGLGAGWHEGEHAAYGFPFPPLGDRMAMLAEQLEIVRGLWGAGEFSFAGEHYALGPVDARPKPSRPRLIAGGAAGPRGLALAARFADEYNTTFVTPAACRERRAAWDAACGGTRKPFSVMLGAVLGRDGGEVEARRRALAARRGQPGFGPGPEWLAGTPDAVRAQLDAYAAAGADRVMVQLLLHDDLDQIALLGELQG